MANVELKSVVGLSGKRFTVPLYQRGYRWEEQQVKDLLEDIAAFMVPEAKPAPTSAAKSALARDDAGDSFYCLQPLAVKESVKDKKSFLEALPKSDTEDVLGRTREVIDDNIRWEVIDGQQRLTTVWLILNFLGKTNMYVVEFARWKGKKQLADIFANLSSDPRKDTIDEHHIRCANAIIKRFFVEEKKASGDYKTQFCETLLNKVQFIWYEVDEPDPVKVFTRLNVGKIALTNSELIKALFLNRSNFAGDRDFETTRLRQMEISGRWDEIEATLQDEEFWMFIHEPGFDKPTRIDFIFDLICEMSQDGSKERIGNDKYRTFRYFNEYFHSEKARKQAEENHSTLVEQCWRDVDGIFAAFKEWFGDLTLYHYVGFLIACGMGVQDVLGLWTPQQKKNITKADFISSLKEKIKVKIKDGADLGQQYEMGTGPSKTKCSPLLLLHNVQSVINQNAVETSKYGVAAFYRFPFHLFKIEKWNVEHIDSNTENSLEEDKDRTAWLKSTYCILSDDDMELKDAILKYFILQEKETDKNELTNKFQELYTNIVKRFAPTKNKLDDNGKNKIGNFTLLDETTNKSYGNAIFPVKKMILMGKCRGWEFEFKEIKKDSKIVDFEIEAHPLEKAEDGNDRKTAFVPPVTMSAFLKAFNPIASNAWTWDADDARYYRKNIYDTLREFGVILPKEDQKHEQ